MKWKVSMWVLAAFLLGSASAQAMCPREYLQRTPNQVLDDLRAAVDGQDWGLVACNYAANAYIIDDQGILVGRTDIIAAFQSLSMLFNGVSPTILQQDVYRDTARVLWRLDAGWIVIPDGMDSYIIRRGAIRKQTRHGLIEFTGPPPE